MMREGVRGLPRRRPHRLFRDGPRLVKTSSDHLPPASSLCLLAAPSASIHPSTTRDCHRGLCIAVVMWRPISAPTVPSRSRVCLDPEPDTAGVTCRPTCRQRCTSRRCANLGWLSAWPAFQLTSNCARPWPNAMARPAVPPRSPGTSHRLLLPLRLHDGRRRHS